MADIDGFVDIESVVEHDKERSDSELEVLVQRDSGRVTRYFGKGWAKVYNQCHKNPKVLMYIIL